MYQPRYFLKKSCAGNFKISGRGYLFSKAWQNFVIEKSPWNFSKVLKTVIIKNNYEQMFLTALEIAQNFKIILIYWSKIVLYYYLNTNLSPSLYKYRDWVFGS